VINVLKISRFCFAFLVSLLPDTLNAQHEAHGAAAAPAEDSVLNYPLGVAASREGSGTSWLPTATPMYALHRTVGSWELMFHGNGFLQYIREGSERGNSQLGSVNWLMIMGHSELKGGRLGLHAMASIEPWTVTSCGYPDLLATGEFCNDEPLHDRQHPHDLFMEVAGMYDRPITDAVAFQLYGGLAGEPALGPVAYPHRISAMPGPSAPIGHHWQDATHITFGVLTGGLYGSAWKVEGSLFNGREPDQERFDLDLGSLNSYAGRVWWLPNEFWALQVSAGKLVDAEPAHDGGGERVTVTRATASATYHRPLLSGGIIAMTAVWGRNFLGQDASDSFLIENTLNLAEHNVFTFRGEFARKSGEELAMNDATLHDQVFDLTKLSFGYVRKLGSIRGFVPGIGAQVNLSLIPRALAEAEYGQQHVPGFAVFLNLRAAPISHASEASEKAQPHHDAASSASK
jgi:hypothetical protein